MGETDDILYINIRLYMIAASQLGALQVESAHRPKAVRLLIAA